MSIDYRQRSPAEYRLRSPADRLSWVVSAWRWFVPAMTVLLLVVLTTAPIVLPWPALPALGFVAVFVWTTFQPGLMPPWLAFVLGLAADALMGAPFGVSATLFALTALFVRLFERRFGHHRFGFDWAVLTSLAIAYAVLAQQLSVIAGTSAPLLPLLVQAAVTALSYPFVVLVCGRVQRRLLR